MNRSISLRDFLAATGCTLLSWGVFAVGYVIIKSLEAAG